MRIFLRTHLTDGLWRRIEVADGTSVGDLLGRFGGRVTSRMLVRVNRQRARLADSLKPIDRVTTTTMGTAARCSADQLVAAGIAAHWPCSARRARKKVGLVEQGCDDPVIKLIRERREALPPEIQKEMNQELQRDLNHHPFSLRISE